MEMGFIFGDLSMGWRVLTVYLLAVNVLTFIVFGIDKYKAVRHRFRISVKTLFALVMIGGSLGGLLAMYIFRHKIRKLSFVAGIPLILIVQASLLLFILFL